MQKTIGGDRLGSGKKMKVDLHGYERSTHDLGNVFRTTMSCGTIVPFLKKIALPGDTFDINLHCTVMTHPTVGPLFGSYKVQLDIFQCPLRLYQAQLHNNKLGIGMRMQDVFLPFYRLRAPSTENEIVPDIDNSQVNPSSILAYTGVRGAGTNKSNSNVAFRNKNGLPILMYWDIYKNYYSNKQEEIGAVIHTTPLDIITNTDEISVGGIILGNGIWQAPPVIWTMGALVILTRIAITPQPPDQISIAFGSIAPGGPVTLYKLSEITQFNGVTGLQDEYTVTFIPPEGQAVYWVYLDQSQTPITEIDITTFPLANIDEMREKILQQNIGIPFQVNGQGLIPYDLPFQENTAGTMRSIMYSQEGLALKTYQSDLFNNWMNTEWIDGAGGIADVTAIDTSGGSFTIDTLNLSKKVYDMLNRVAITGGTYDDWQDAIWAHDRYIKCETPMYMGGLIKELIFEKVVSNSASGNDTSEKQPLGTLAGQGKMAAKHKGGEIVIRIDEPSYIMGMVSITPRLDYSQGNDWDSDLETMNDLHKPALDEIGFQELITEQMAWWDTSWNNVGGVWETKSAGKQPAWINYMTEVNKTYGNFAIKNNEMFMTLNRNYTALQDAGLNTTTIEDLTTYVDPRIYNQIFAETTLDSQNFWTQIGIDIKARRKMSAKLMPNL